MLSCASVIKPSPFIFMLFNEDFGRCARRDEVINAPATDIIARKRVL